MDCVDLERRAKARLTELAYDYVAGGAEDEVTLGRNEAAWLQLRLRPRVLRDVSHVETETDVLGARVAQPVLVAPTAAQRLAHDEGEAATARGAAAAGTVMIVSTLATVALEDVAAAAPGAPRWFQLYLRRDRSQSAELVGRVVDAGYGALVLTVDLPVLGHRRREERHPAGLPHGLTFANFADAEGDVGTSWLDTATRTEIDPSVTPDDIAWLAELSGLPVLVKGVLRGDDARVCAEAGAAGVIVSNHGGRQLDTAVTGVDALPEVVAAVGDALEVYVDGGVRRGSDVVKAVALGARAVLVGRPVVWALACGGAEGVRALLDGFRTDLARVMALCGAAGMDDLTPDLVVSS